MNLAKFPRRGYVKEVTPIEYLPNFSKALGNKVNIYIKRDDLLPGCAGGSSVTTCFPAAPAATRPASWTSASPTLWPRARIPSSPAAPCSPTTAV